MLRFRQTPMDQDCDVACLPRRTGACWVLCHSNKRRPAVLPVCYIRPIGSLTLGRRRPGLAQDLSHVTWPRSAKRQARQGATSSPDAAALPARSPAKRAGRRAAPVGDSLQAPASRTPPSRGRACSRPPLAPGAAAPRPPPSPLCHPGSRP